MLQQPIPDSRVHGAKMGPIWGRQDPGGPHVGPMNLAIWVLYHSLTNQWYDKPSATIHFSTPAQVKENTSDAQTWYSYNVQLLFKVIK